jgi:hypothetical protein
MRHILLLVCLIAGCHRAPPATSAPTTTTSSASTGPAAVCPAAYADVKEGAACSGAASCSFPEGTCSCGPGSYCGGTPPPKSVTDALKSPRWQCEAAMPAYCPTDKMPSGACGDQPLMCSYSQGCCFTRYECRGGTWENTGGGCPP